MYCIERDWGRESESESSREAWKANVHVSKCNVTVLLVWVWALHTPFPTLFSIPLLLRSRVLRPTHETLSNTNTSNREWERKRSRQKTLLLLRGGHWQQTKRRSPAQCNAAQWKRIYCLLPVPWRTVVVCAYLQHAIIHTRGPRVVLSPTSSFITLSTFHPAHP